MYAPVIPFFFFNDPATTEIYTLSLHDALPISRRRTTCSSGSARARGGPPRAEGPRPRRPAREAARRGRRRPPRGRARGRSEEHTSELQSRQYLVCRLLLEKKNNYTSHQYRVHC